MQTSMKPLFMHERAMRFLEETVVHSMEGALFFLLSSLFTLAGVAAVFEDSSRPAGGTTMAVSVPAPSSPLLPRPPPLQLAVLQQASNAPPARR